MSNEPKNISSRFLLDTHILFWSLTDQKDKFSQEIYNMLEEARELILPTIVLLELFRLLQKKKKGEYFDIFLKNLPDSKYIIVPLDINIVQQTTKIKAELEIHDKVIVATAQLLNVRLISKDEEITRVYKKTIW